MDKLYSKVNRYRFLSRLIIGCVIAFSWPSFAAEKINFAPAYIAISDAIGATKSGQQEAAKNDLGQMRQYLNSLSIADTAKKQLVVQALETASNSPSVDNLTALSASLIQLEKYVNPVDYDTLRKQFIKRVMPSYQAMASAVAKKVFSSLNSSFLLLLYLRRCSLRV